MLRIQMLERLYTNVCTLKAEIEEMDRDGAGIDVIVDQSGEMLKIMYNEFFHKEGSPSPQAHVQVQERKPYQ